MTEHLDSRDCECERWRDGATVCPVHPDSTKPAGWGVTPERALKKARKKIRKLREELAGSDRAIATLNNRISRAETTIADMREHWRPVPIVHEWQPRNPQCLYCDEPREAVRHQRTTWAEEYGDQPPAEQAD